MAIYKCPICEGHGFVPSSFYERAGETVSFGDYTRMQYRYTLCRHCSGKGVIQDEPTAAKQTPKTNGDRIRAMNDEDLAVLIADDWCERACRHKSHEVCDSECEKHILDWLRQPIAEEARP